MDTPFIKSEAEYEDQYYYSLGASSQPQAFMGNSGNGYIEGEEALDTLKLEYGIETSSGNGYIEGEEALDTLKLEYGIETSSGIENIEGKETLDTLNLEYGIESRDEEGSKEEDAAKARRLALQKARSLAFGSFIGNVKYKDSATDRLITYHNYRLRGILAELLSQHRWKESAGVLSVLLKASVKDNYFFRHQYKYWAAMEVLRQLEGFVQQNATTYKRIYWLLKSKQPAPKRAINKRLRPAIQLELALHLMSQGDLFGAREASKSYHYTKDFEADGEVKEGLYKCIERMVPDSVKQDEIHSKLLHFNESIGTFGMAMAVRGRARDPPAYWWQQFGSQCHELQKFAVRILSQTCSASGCERNWSVFERIHTKKRNRLEQKRLNDMVFVQYNLRLRRNQLMNKTPESSNIFLDDIDPSSDWVVETQPTAFDHEDLSWMDLDPEPHQENVATGAAQPAHLSLPSGPGESSQAQNPPVQSTHVENVESDDDSESDSESSEASFQYADSDY